MAQFFFRALPVITAKDATMDFEQLTFALNNGDVEVNAKGELKLKAPEAFKLLSGLTYKNSWEDFEASRKGEYRKNPFANVELRGLIKGGESGKLAVTLPAGYRPKNTEAFVVRSAANTAATVEITATGEVVPTNIGGEVKNGVFFDGINFSVE